MWENMNTKLMRSTTFDLRKNAQMEVINRNLVHLLRVLATEVTPGLLAGAEPDAHHFYVMIVHRWVIKWKETRNSSVPTLKTCQVCISK